MKGVEEMETPPTRSVGVWDPSIILKYYQTQPNNEDLSLRQLTYKLTILLALASAQRVQTLHKLDLQHFTATDNAFCFVLPTRLKQTKNGHATPDVYIPKSTDAKICVWNCLWCYIHRTRKLREHTELLLITIPPYTPATTQSISQWIRTILARAGVNPKVFKAHSTRAAASSKAHKFLAIEAVLAAADWKGVVTFNRHYNKLVDPRDVFAQAVWNGEDDGD